MLAKLASVAITQAAGGCTYSLSMNTLAFAQAGVEQSVKGCQWVYRRAPAASGNGTVTLEATPNLFPWTRPSLYSLTIDITNNTVTLSQPGTSSVSLSH
jgi:hypothetical protein